MDGRGDVGELFGVSCHHVGEKPRDRANLNRIQLRDGDVSRRGPRAQLVLRDGTLPRHRRRARLSPASRGVTAHPTLARGGPEHDRVAVPPGGRRVDIAHLLDRLGRRPWSLAQAPTAPFPFVSNCIDSAPR